MVLKTAAVDPVNYRRYIFYIFLGLLSTFLTIALAAVVRCCANRAPAKVCSRPAVFRIHDILVCIRIRIHASDQWIRIRIFSSLTFKMPAKNKFFNAIFSACYFLKVHLHYFSKIKSQKESQNSRIQDFSYNFCMMIEGSGSGRPKNTWIRIEIQSGSRVLMTTN